MSNSEFPVVDAFWVGPQKAASTWAYQCFKEHPDICAPQNNHGPNSPYFFDINYFRGIDWYANFYSHWHDEDVLIDTTMTYLRSSLARERINNYNPEAKIITCLRNPIDRAFSHYWHEKKKEKISFEFCEVFDNYDLFQNWIEPGFYERHLKEYFDLFGRDKVKVTLLDDLAENDRSFIKDIFRFLDVDSGFVPSVVGQKVNTAGYVRNWKWKVYNKMKRLSAKLIPEALLSRIDISGSFNKFEDLMFDKSEYQKGMESEVRQQLIEIFEPHIKELEDLIGRDLNHWLESTNNK